jgi:hypothetical protein
MARASEISPDRNIATREEALEILTEKAREGSISAAIALERALRAHAAELAREDELEEILNR